MKTRTIRIARRVTQGLSFVLFLGLFVFALPVNPPPPLAGLFQRLDPLTAITAMLAGRVFLAGMALAGVTLALTLIFGRVWCGWVCPLGTTLDVLRPRRKKATQAPQEPLEGLRGLKTLLLVFLLVSAALGSQSLLFLDPITIMTRTLAGAVWPALGFAVSQVEAFLYNFEFLWDGLDALHSGVVYPLFKDAQPVYGLAALLLLFFAGIVALNWLAERFWCRYVCPLGGLLGILSRFALVRRVVRDDCSGCAVCSRKCPTGTIDPRREFRSDPAECTVCCDCVSACRQGKASFRLQIPRIRAGSSQPYDPSRRALLGALGAAVGWVAISGVETIQKRQPAALIRPPGVDLVNFGDRCIRCGLCVRACQTHGLQPDGLAGGWQNILTPHLEPRLGACSYNCAACGSACPTGAIPSLTLEEKRQQTIGLARVDRNRCLPWAYNIDCIICEESCPISDKAIKLETAEVTNGYGDRVTVKRPYVVKERCIGCGMCEFQCPMGGDAAVRVFAYTEAEGFDPTLPE